METYKLLIADSNPELCHSLAKLLGEQYQIRVCHNGQQALELLHSFDPDLLYIDLMLPQLDGLTVLQTAVQEDVMPVTMVSVGLQSPYIERKLEQLQVDYVVRKPCSLKAIVSNIRELALIAGGEGGYGAPPAPEVSDVLLHLGFHSHLDGFRYVTAGFPLYSSNPQQTVTKELYPAIAKIYGKNGKHVERSIRHAIDKAWLHRDDSKWRQYFQPAPDGSIPRPTNMQLLHILMRAVSATQTAEKIG